MRLRVNMMTGRAARLARRAGLLHVGRGEHVRGRALLDALAEHAGGAEDRRRQAGRRGCRIRRAAPVIAPLRLPAAKSCIGASARGGRRARAAMATARTASSAARIPIGRLAMIPFSRRYVRPAISDLGIGRPSAGRRADMRKAPEHLPRRLAQARWLARDQAARTPATKVPTSSERRSRLLGEVPGRAEHLAGGGAGLVRGAADADDVGRDVLRRRPRSAARCGRSPPSRRPAPRPRRRSRWRSR